MKILEECSSSHIELGHFQEILAVIRNMLDLLRTMIDMNKTTSEVSRPSTTNIGELSEN